MTKHDNGSQRGFAGLEVMLLIVIVAVIAGIGFWVQRRNGNDKTQTSLSQGSQAVDPSKAGTTEGIDQLMQASVQSEESIDAKNLTSEQADASSTNTAQKNIGGAYDESSL